MNQKLLKRLIPVLLACALAAGAAGYFFNKPAPPQENPVLEEYVDPALTEGVFNTNLTGITFAGGKWEGTDEGLHSTALGAGDCFLYSDTSAKNFIYSVDVKFLKDEGAASLVFRGDERGSHYNCYAVNLDAGSKLIKFWRWFKGDAGQLSSELKVEERPDKCYNLKVVVIDSWVSYFVNDVLMASSGDYILSGDARGQYTVPEEGYLGLLNWNGDMIFQNAYYTPIEDDAKPYLKSMTVRASGGSAEASSQFSFDEPITLQYVDNDTETVDIAAEAFSKDAVITVAGPDGREYEGGKGIPVEVGKNIITVTSTTKADDKDVTLTYRVNVHRRQPEAVYYNEPYRDQYHYSVKDGWGNDPNGLVYYKGTYHLFYQFYDDIAWGPMHWGHAVSKDLLTWEEKPIAFYPDTNGAMFSGCIVVDDQNTSGLFKSPEGGLVALITCDGSGQRIKLAYSEDEGETWTKVKQIAADWTDDPLHDGAFRDPKVFRWEGKWFMVIAGGPLRIYSSDNLIDWTCETTYADLHTECPDLYPIQADDGRIKWVLDRGGRAYKVGDFTSESGAWAFVPDQAYADRDAVMNFGKDSYAAMTYYIQDFGTAAEPTLPEIIEINWMNTWDDYCNRVAAAVGQNFNGTYNLFLKEGLVKDGDSYLLTQTPIEAYDSLRGEAIEAKGVSVTPESDLFADFRGDTYEIQAVFHPGGNTRKVGFDLRKNGDEKTSVIYDLEAGQIYIDRSRSGIIISRRFADVDRQDVSTDEDGSVTMHIYVDRASVEVFTKNYTVTGANQIFPSADALGLSAVSEGDTSTADITVYPLKSIWTPASSDVPVAMTAPSSGSVVYVGGELTLNTTLIPMTGSQDVGWSVSDESVVSISSEGSRAVVSGLKTGKATVTATAAANEALTKNFEITVLENNFDTNLGEFEAVVGDWIVDDKILTVSNQSSNDFYMAKTPVDQNEYTIDTRIRFTKGFVNIFFAANSMDPFDRQAYAVQVSQGSSSVRIFRFAGDTIFESSMGKAISDDEWHDISIKKTTDSVSVSVDGQEAVTASVADPEDYFNGNPYVGIGIWDGAMEVDGFKIQY